MGQDLQVPEIEEENLGPKMRELTGKQRRFVRAVLLVGGKAHMRAAAIAGYGGSKDSLANTGYNLMKNPKITAALVEEGFYSLQAGVADALATVIEIARGDELPKKGALRLKAAGMILDRAGLPMQTVQNINITKKTETEAVLLVQLEAMIKKNPEYVHTVPAPLLKMLEARKAPKKEVVDAEFTEVADTAIDPDADLLG